MKRKNGTKSSFWKRNDGNACRRRNPGSSGAVSEVTAEDNTGDHDNHGPVGEDGKPCNYPSDEVEDQNKAGKGCRDLASPGGSCK